MRFIVMHKVDANMEAGGPPSQEIIRKMGELVQASLKSGEFLNGAGLHRSAQRVRVAFQNGRRTLTKGPYAGRNELIAACHMIKVKSMEHAIEQAARFAEILGDVEIEVGPVVEPWDLGLIPKPADQPSARFLLLQKGNAGTESGAVDPRTRAALADLQKRMTEEGTLLSDYAFAPSSLGKRLPSASKAKRTWVDGPFTESKELIAGFSILNLPTQQSALAWADRYAAILGDNEVDVRELTEG
jgi:hypothetical protein